MHCPAFDSFSCTPPATVATREVQDLTSSAVQCVGAAKASSQGQN